MSNSYLVQFLRMSGENPLVFLSCLLRSAINQKPSFLSSDTNIPSTPDIKETICAFKQSLQMTTAQHVKQCTREQWYSTEWFLVCRYRITASHFGEILHHHRDTPPD